MLSFHETVEIDADPEATWRVLGDLASVEVDGMTRVCTFEDGRVQHEQISDYSPEQRTYRYAIEGGLPVKGNRGRFAVEPLDPAAEAELAEMWRSALPVVHGNVNRLVEDAAT